MSDWRDIHVRDIHVRDIHFGVEGDDPEQSAMAFFAGSGEPLATNCTNPAPRKAFNASAS